MKHYRLRRARGDLWCDFCLKKIPEDDLYWGGDGRTEHCNCEEYTHEKTQAQEELERKSARVVYKDGVYIPRSGENN